MHKISDLLDVWSRLEPQFIQTNNNGQYLIRLKGKEFCLNLDPNRDPEWDELSAALVTQAVLWLIQCSRWSLDLTRREYEDKSNLAWYCMIESETCVSVSEHKRADEALLTTYVRFIEQDALNKEWLSTQ